MCRQTISVRPEGPIEGIVGWLNYVFTNRIPRGLANRLMYRLSRVEHPLISRPALWVWRHTAPLNLDEALEDRFVSIHHCFSRRLKPGARPVSERAGCLVSPCDGHVVAAGSVCRGMLMQVKGSEYSLAELLCSEYLAARYEGGTYLTIRISASMYHRLHAPETCEVTRVDYIPGDTYNVNPHTLSRLDRVYCRNERAVVHLNMRVEGSNVEVLLIPVAAILVGGIVLCGLPGEAPSVERRVDHWAVEHDAHGGGRAGARSDAGRLIRLRHALGAQMTSFARGEELGRFEHGSTVVMVLPDKVSAQLVVRVGDRLRMGEEVLQLKGESVENCDYSANRVGVSSGA